MAVFDCFIFFDELDLLEIRLHELSGVVDRFVLAEATRTFSGAPKPLHFEENRERFRAFADRLVHVVVDDMPLAGKSRWDREAYQRNQLARGLADAQPNDLIILSDVDEIPRADAVSTMVATGLRPNDVACFELRMYNYFLNFEAGERWLRLGPRACLRSRLPGMQQLRLVKGPSPDLVRNALRGLRAWFDVGRPVRRSVYRDAGWHFTYLGGVEQIQRKLRARAGDNAPKPHLNDDWLLGRIRDGVVTTPRSTARLILRPLGDEFPHYVVENRQRFAHLIHDWT